MLADHRVSSLVGALGLELAAHLKALHKVLSRQLPQLPVSFRSGGARQRCPTPTFPLAAIPTVGEAFDPRIHEALGTVDRDDMPDQHVAEEVRRGYRLRDRLIRPALVRVAHNPNQVNE